MKRKTKKNTKEEKEASNVYLYIDTKEREILQKRMSRKPLNAFALTLAITSAPASPKAI